MVCEGVNIMLQFAIPVIPFKSLNFAILVSIQQLPGMCYIRILPVTLYQQHVGYISLAKRSCFFLFRDLFLLLSTPQCILRDDFLRFKQQLSRLRKFPLSLGEFSFCIRIFLSLSSLYRT